MIQYGLISQTDARTLEKTMDLICDEFDDEVIYVTEIGVYAGATGTGIFKYLWNIKSRNVKICGIDNGEDGEEFKYFLDYANVITGNSNEVYNRLEDNSQHLILADGDHSLIGVVSDFYAYADKVKVGGYFAFHDTGKHIKPFKDFQHGDKDNPDAYISVRKALEKIGLFGLDYGAMAAHYGFPKSDTLKYFGLLLEDGSTHRLTYPRWQLIFDEADINDEAGGICVFKKLY